VLGFVSQVELIQHTRKARDHVPTDAGRRGRVMNIGILCRRARTVVYIEAHNLVNESEACKYELCVIRLVASDTNDGQLLA